MLSQLSIHDFAIIDDINLPIKPGFVVLTGETGAGKSIILDAVTLVLGGRADSSMVRAGSSTAFIEAEFVLNEALQEVINPLLLEDELQGDYPGLLVLAREVRENGRSIARVNGRTVSLAQLRTIAEPLVDIHGQGEHLSLLKPKAHLPLLDSYAALNGQREIYAGVVAQLQAVQNELHALRRDEKLIAQRVDMLTYQIDEIAAAALEPGEDEALREERTRLANAEKLQNLTSEINAALIGVDGDTQAAIDLIGEAERALHKLADVDDAQKELLQELQGLSYQLSEIAARIQEYQDNLEHNPQHLNEVEERLELINTLKRKYGETIAEILATHDRATAELQKISNSEERIAALETERESLLHRVGELGEALSLARQEAAKKLSAAVEGQLQDLYMEGARFAVSFERELSAEGAYGANGRYAFDRGGLDRAEFVISANPGEPLKPMARVASGGETARLMLALKSALAAVDATPTLIFDEIDQGIGGRVGDIVGRKLWSLAAVGEHQVIIVTHLPQLAGYGDAHLQVSKAVNGGRTTTQVNQLDRNGRVDELAAMLGTGHETAVNGANAILNHVQTVKEKGSLPNRSVV
ncbi:MAG: DNA repair protein RecN [Candidatus Promineifilaceae bacterium]|jgi:DNA repair protein RecN (Recombination protein N)